MSGSIREVGWARTGSGFMSGGFVLGWLLYALGVYGSWLDPCARALSLSGPDLGEFVKFLPSVQNGALDLYRQSFYLPAAVFSVTVALLAFSPRLQIAAWVRCSLLGLGILASLQILPPAWTPASIRAEEFRVQVAGTAFCWLLMLASSLLRRLPVRLTALLAALATAGSDALVTGQLRLVRPEVGALYGSQPALGWGFWATQAGTLVLTGTAVWAIVRAGRHNPVAKPG